MKRINQILIGMLGILTVSCQEFLDVKPDKTLVVPSKVQDLQAVLDNAVFMNEQDASFGDASTDDYYLPINTYNTLKPVAKEAYTWLLLQYNYGNDWAHLYDVVYFCNFTLENLQKIERTKDNAVEWDYAKGSALFFRAQTFLKLAWLFAPAYDEKDADKKLGIVLRNTTDFNVEQGRSNLADTYRTIINDLEEASHLLPAQASHVMRASKRAAYAYLSRAYLSMRNYPLALKNAELALDINSYLMDFNDPLEVKITTTRPFMQFNKEVVFQKIISQYYFSNVAPQTLRVDSNLYQSYDSRDLRKTAFFRPAAPEGYSFKGTYNGNLNNSFTGIANDELYLTIAECLARKGNVVEAMDVLNRLLIKRWEKGKFTAFTAKGQDEAVDLILRERRKELVFRDIRWMDLKRLNQEGRNIILRRKIGEKMYELLPNDKRYALPLPSDIISNITVQNPYDYN